MGFLAAFLAFGCVGAGLYAAGRHLSKHVFAASDRKRRWLLLFGFEHDTQWQLGRALTQFGIIALALAVVAFALGVLSAPPAPASGA